MKLSFYLSANIFELNGQTFNVIYKNRLIIIWEFKKLISKQEKCFFGNIEVNFTAKVLNDSTDLNARVNLL